MDRAMKRQALAAGALLLCLTLVDSARAADADNGKAVFQKTCANCHTIEIGLNKVGPTLWAVVGRPVASVPDYDYSTKMRSMRSTWKVWNDKHLDAYLTHPRELLHGVKMFYAVPDGQTRADVIAYLKTLR
jgi:cytochrome c